MFQKSDGQICLALPLNLVVDIGLLKKAALVVHTSCGWFGNGIVFAVFAMLACGFCCDMHGSAAVCHPLIFDAAN